MQAIFYLVIYLRIYISGNLSGVAREIFYQFQNKPMKKFSGNAGENSEFFSFEIILFF